MDRSILTIRNAISNMELGQGLLSIINAMKESMGANWTSYYESSVDIRHRQIIQNNFGPI